MHRLLIAAVGAALLAASAVPTLADEYPPCQTREQDHCRVMMGWHPMMHPMHYRHHHHHH